MPCVSINPISTVRLLVLPPRLVHMAFKHEKNVACGRVNTMVKKTQQVHKLGMLMVETCGSLNNLLKLGAIGIHLLRITLYREL